MIAEQMLNYLETNGYGIEGTDLFFDFLPDSPDNCIVLYDEGAATIPESTCISVDVFGLQIIVRNSSTKSASLVSRNIHKLISGLGGNDFRLSLNGDYISYIGIETAPHSIGKDSNGRSQWSSHYNVRTMSSNDSNRL